MRATVGLLLFLTLALTVLTGRDVQPFFRAPFHGLPLLPNATLSTRAFVPLAKQGPIAGLHPEDRITAVDGVRVTSADDVRAAAARAGVGATLTYTVERAGQAPFPVVVPVTTFTASDYRQVYLPSKVAGIAFLIVAAIPVWIRPELLSARLLFLAFWGGTTNFLLLPVDFFFAQRLTPWLRAGGLLMMASLFHLGLVFPEARGPARRFPRATAWAIYGGSGLLAAALAATFWHPGPLLLAINLTELGGVGCGSMVLLANIIRTATRSPDPVRRQQAWVAAAAPALTAITVALLLLGSWNAVPIHLHPLVFPAPLLPAVALMAYAIVKHNVFEFDTVVRRTLTFGALIVAGGLGYFLVSLATELWFGPFAAAALPVAFVLLLLPASPVLLRWVEQQVEATLFRERRQAREEVRNASRDLVRLRAPDELAALVAGVAERALGATAAEVVVGRSGESLRPLSPTRSSAPTLAPEDPLYLSLQQGSSLHLDEVRRQGVDGGTHARALALGFPLIVALPPTEGLIGGLFLGPRRDGRFYTHDDLLLMETFAAHSAVAIDNARVWEELRSLQRRLAEENVFLREASDTPPATSGIIGQSAAVGQVLNLIPHVGASDSSVLVEGETGTGKELVVAALHAASRRADKPLLKVACAALPETLLESELFGHERGAFTGAASARTGRFEMADGGTLFFDDVDTLPLAVQAKLLRAVQEGEVQRLGSNDIRMVDVRVISASNRDLLAEVRAGRFREDLYYRLNVVPMRLPPLRERREDIPLLVEHFIREQGPRLGRIVQAIAPDTLAQLQAHTWPGNVRELRNVVERSLVLGTGDVFRLAAPLDASEAQPASGSNSEGGCGSAPLAELLRRYKIRLLTEALIRSGGNQRVAAEILGMHRPSLTRMLRDLGLEVPTTAAAKSPKAS